MQWRKNNNKINFMCFAPFLKSQIQLAANWTLIAINCHYYVPLKTPNTLVFWAMVLHYFSGTNACSKIIQCSQTKTEVTKRLKAISVILLAAISTGSRSRCVLCKVQNPSQVPQDLKTEQKMPITKRHAFWRLAKKETKNYSLERILSI